MNNSGYYYFDKNGSLASALKDENGIPIKKTPQTHPYSYDCHLIAGKYNNEVKKGYINGCAYDDRLLQADYKKYEHLKQKYLSKGMSLDNVEKLLREYYSNNKITMVNIMKGCNSSTGYPYYVFQYHIEE